jgi:starvation-inducible DNA-binding protein
MSVRTSERTRLFDTRIDIEKDTRLEMIAALNAQLADTFDMFSLIKQAHWNVKGPQFIALHELFDEIAAGLLAHVDTIAERVTALGGTALGTVRMSAENSRLDPYPEDVFEDMGVVDAMAERMADLAASTRQASELSEKIDDMASNDLLLEACRDLDKWLWFLEAHLQVE